MLILNLFVFTFSILAETPQTPPASLQKEAPAAVEKSFLDKTKDVPGEVNKFLLETRERRQNNKYYVLVTYSPFDLIIPGKYGITAGMIRSADKTWEFEYLRGSMSVPFLSDLGRMTDEKYSFIIRSYSDRNSFNVSYGLSYFDFSMHIGDRILNKVPGGRNYSIDFMQIQSLGFNIGVGNRWSFKKDITLGVDWISWSQPVFVTNRQSAILDYATDPTDRSDIEKTLKFFSYFPRFTFFKLQVGILF